MIIKLLAEHHLEFLSLKGGCRGSSESTVVKMSKFISHMCDQSRISIYFRILWALEIHYHQLIKFLEIFTLLNGKTIIYESVNTTKILQHIESN